MKQNKTKTQTTSLKIKQTRDRNTTNTQSRISQPANTRSNTLISHTEHPKETLKDCTVRLDDYIDADIDYVHHVIKSHRLKCEYYEDPMKRYRLYYFDTSTDSRTLINNTALKNLTNNSLLQISNAPIFEYDDTSPHNATQNSIDSEPSVERAFSTEGEEEDDEEEEGEIREQENTQVNKQTQMQNDTNTRVTQHENTDGHPSQNIVKIFNHITKGGNPLFLKTLCTQHKVNMPFTHYFGYKTKISTLIFDTKLHAQKFIQTINPQNFGPKAHYETKDSNKTQTQNNKTDTHEWNAVIKGVDPDITEDEFARELDDHEVDFKRIIRIFAPNGERTHLIRIFFHDKESTSQAIFNGITILGRRYRVEAPREEARHIPCKNCAQYGHIRFNCNNSPVCHKCGRNPNLCQHKPQDKAPMYCATCNQSNHYTGQVRCPEYPRNMTPPLVHKYTPLANQTHVKSPPKPSLQNFPTLKPVWHTRTSTHPQEGLGEEHESTEHSSTVPDLNLTSQIDTAFQQFQTNIMNIIEDYVDKKIEKLQDDLIKYTTTLIDNTIKPKDRKTLQTVANSTAKRIWKKRVQIIPVDNTIDIMISKMEDTITKINQDIRERTLNKTNNNGTLAPPLPSSTNT